MNLLEQIDEYVPADWSLLMTDRNCFPYSCYYSCPVAHITTKQEHRFISPALKALSSSASCALLFDLFYQWLITVHLWSTHPPPAATPSGDTECARAVRSDTGKVYVRNYLYVTQ